MVALDTAETLVISHLALAADKNSLPKCPCDLAAGTMRLRIAGLLDQPTAVAFSSPISLALPIMHRLLLRVGPQVGAHVLAVPALLACAAVAGSLLTPNHQL